MLQKKLKIREDFVMLWNTPSRMTPSKMLNIYSKTILLYSYGASTVKLIYCLFFGVPVFMFIYPYFIYIYLLIITLLLKWMAADKNMALKKIKNPTYLPYNILN